MVIVEFFDRTPIENMIGAFANQPEKVVLVGQISIMKKQDHVFRRFLSATGNSKTQLEYRGVRVHELSEIVKALTQVAEDYPDCCFDLTGGDDLTMVAIGIVFERYREKGLELHQYNIRTGRIYDCDLNGNVLNGQIPDLTVEQNIILHGGCIVSSDQRESGTYDWKWDAEFLEDVTIMWEVCRNNPGLWNAQINMLDEAEKYAKKSEDPLELQFHLPTVEAALKRKKYHSNLGGVLISLLNKGMLTELTQQDDYCIIRFKNEQVRRCLTKAGTVLELKTYLVAKSITEKDSSLRYNDIMTGVFIDWDGVVHEKGEIQVDTENEIDLILMHGLVPVFVSCKNGAVDIEELYKLQTVANRFGGAYARKVLVATTLGKRGESRDYFLQRALDMGINVLTDVHMLSDKQFASKIKSVA